MRIRLDPTTGLPLYRQLAHALRTAIASGELAPQAPLPSARDLAQDLRVNYHTARRAFQELEEAGLIVRQRGAPYRVAQRDGAMEALELLREDAQRLARRAEDLGIDPQTALDLVAEALARPLARERSA